MIRRKYRRITVVIPACLLACCLLFAACGKESMKPDAYIRWVEEEDNGLRISKKMNGYTFSVQYKPAAYMALKQNHSAGADALQREISGFGKLQYYNLSIRTPGGEELAGTGIGREEEYYMRLQYYTSMVQDDITLIQHNDTLPCVLAHFERNYGISPENTLTLAFETPVQDDQPPADRTLVYTDRVLQTGPLQFLVHGNDIAGLPEPQLK